MEGQQALKKEGKGPKEMRVGMRSVIAYEAAADWRRARENDVEAHEKAAKTWAGARAKPEVVAAAIRPKPIKPKLQPKPKRTAKLAAEVGA